MKELPLVSIIIPAYNASAFLAASVGSALGQTYKHVEVIVVDDGSKDNTKELVKQFSGDPRFRYIYQENKGLAGARNAGIRAAEGEYIALLDADDTFLPEKVTKQVEALETHPDYGVCYSDILHVSDTEPRTVYHHTYKYLSGDVFRELLKKQFINPLAVMARKSVFETYGYFDEGLRRSEDWDLWLRWAHGGVKFFYFDVPLAEYTVRSGGNLSSLESEPEMKRKNLEIFERIALKMTEDEKRLYNFDVIMRTLRLKLCVAYLLNGEKRAAVHAARMLPVAYRALVAVAPARLARVILSFARKAKHRLLLKKVQ